MANTIYEYPNDWYQFVSSAFALAPYTIGTRSQFRVRRSARLIEQVFEANYVQRPEVGPSKWQGKGAFFSRLRGDSNLIRIGDPLRCIPQFNRIRANMPAPEPFSDGTYFTDGTGWVGGDNQVPPYATVGANASAGDNFVVIENLPEDMPSPFLYSGDLFEIRPNGISATTAMLYEVVGNNGTDASGRAGVEIAPNLRQNIVKGDQVVFYHPKTVMRLLDPRQGMITRDANRGSFGFACMEETP
jgi:hypothetical protein